MSVAAERLPGGGLAGLRYVLRKNWAFSISLIWMAILLVLAFAGPLIAPYDPNEVDLANAYSGFSLAYPLGTDESGRDILSRVLAAVPATLAGPVIVVVISAISGTMLALIATWFGGWADTLISRFFDVLFAFPGLVIAILAAAMFGSGFWAPVLALSVAFTPMFGRIIRSTAIRERKLPYISALVVQGQSTLVIAFRHILPNLLPVLMVQSAIAFSYALLDLAAISYLGLGQQPPAADWGLLIANGQSGILAGHPEQSIVASVLVLVTVLAMNIIGDVLSQKFEIGER